MRVTLVISSLWGGGAERVLSILANAWAEQGQDVTIITFEQAQARPRSYFILPSVKIRPLGLLSDSSHFLAGALRNARRIRVLRHAIRESHPEIIISFMDQTNVLTVLATRGLGVPLIISERTVARCYQLSRLWIALRRLLYPFADMLVCPTTAGLAGFQAVTKIPGTVIPNPVVIPPGLKCLPRPALDARPRTLISMGRLSQEKGFDLLLNAFSRIAGRHPDWSLTIIGKGPLRSELEVQRAVFGLDGRVNFAGELADPFPVLCGADLFVFPSRYEGFGMALAEAMACGLPVISFDCPEGPRDIIRDGIDGVLVPAEDVSALAAVLSRLMSDAPERARLAARAPEVLARFSRERILFLWQDLFDQLLSHTAMSE